MDDEDYVRSIVAADDVPDAHRHQGSTDNGFDDTVVLHDAFDWMAGFHAYDYIHEAIEF